MFNRISILSIFFIFSFTIMAAEGLKNKEFHSNYKTITFEEKTEQMKSLGLSKEAPFREPNVKALEKRFMIKLQLLDMKRKADFIGKESMISSNGRGECDEGYVDDCSGDGDCCPESWIGDGFADCEDQPWGCDMTCYDNDGGDCAGEGDGGTDGGDPTDDGGTGGDDGGVSSCDEIGGNESWLGDGWCDDINNNETCGYDSGDCCYSTCVSDVYDCEADSGPCTADICIDPDGNNDNCEADDGGDDGGVSSCEEIGGNESYLGDGWCDDVNNNETCGYDSGDCCYSTCVSDVYDCEADSGPCTADICIDPDGNNDNCEAADDGGGDDGGECQNFDCMDQCYDGYEGWIGDGYCDDGSWGLYFNCEEFECDYGDCLNDDGSCAGNTDGGGDDGGEEGCADDQFTCNDGSCIPAAWECDVDWCDCADCEDEADCEGSDGGDGGSEGCDDSQVEDCSDDDCCPEGWIGDGLCDGTDQEWGCDLTCYDNDGGDCDDSADDGGSDGGDDGGDDGGSDEVQAALVLGEGSSIPGGQIEISLYLENIESVAGVQFTLGSNPEDWATVYEISSISDCFEASFNNTASGTIGLIYSLSGCMFEPSDESNEIATLYFDVSANAEWGSVVELYFSEVIVAGDGGSQLNSSGYGGVITIGTIGDVNHDGNIDVIDAVSMISFILQVEEPTESQVWAADINEDGSLNILDVVMLIEIILGD